MPVVEESTKEEAQREGYIEESDGRALPVAGLAPGLTEWDVPTYVHISFFFFFFLFAMSGWVDGEVDSQTSPNCRVLRLFMLLYTVP